MDATTVALMERQDGGLSVALLYDRQTGCMSLAVSEGEEPSQVVAVPAERAMDAFLHPSLYVGGICGCLRCKTLDASAPVPAC